MASFNVKCSQKLDDGDTALVEEYHHVDRYDVMDIVQEYHRRAISKSYVMSYTIIVDIKAS